MSNRRVVLSALLVLLLLPGTAAAAPDWAPTITFPVPGNAYGGAAEIQYQSGGIATEAFLEVQSLSPLKTTLHVGTVPPGAGYSDQLVIPSAEGAIPASVKIAVAHDGAAVAAWTELTGSTVTSPYRYRAAYRPAGSTTWEAPITIATDSSEVEGMYEYLTTAIGPDGSAAAGVQHIAIGDPAKAQGEPDYRLDVAVHPSSGGWQAPARISPASQSGEGLSLAFDGSGDLTAAYTLRFSEGGTSKTEDDSYTVITRRRPASSGIWGPQEDITKSEITWTADALRLGENEAGDAVVTYQYVRKSPQSLDVWAVTRQGPNGSWTAPAHVVNGSSAPVAGGVAPNGMAYILYWFQGVSSGESCEGVLRAPAGGSFTAHHCVSPENQDTFSGSLAFLGNDAYMAWSGNVPGESENGDVQGARWADASTLPDVARNLDPSGLPYGSPTLVNDEQGSVVAFFTNALKQTRAAAYDAGPPIMTGASVPASATAGQPAAFSSTFVDLWSGLAPSQPLWSFGDGASASGGSVTHTFTAPGTYTVTLTATDAFGNATSSQHTVVVSAPSAPADTRPPHVTINRPACPKRLSKRKCTRYRERRSSWRSVTGTVTDSAPSSGIASVRIAVYRTKGKHVEGLFGKRFKKTTRSKARSAFATVKPSGTKWSFKLPSLKPGLYTILVRAKDRAGNQSAVSLTLRLK
jgi:PKD repeat protein